MNPRHREVLDQVLVAIGIFAIFIGAAVFCFGCSTTVSCATQPPPPAEFEPLTCYTSSGPFQTAPANEWGTSTSVVQTSPEHAWPCLCTVTLVAEENGGLNPVVTSFTGSCP